MADKALFNGNGIVRATDHSPVSSSIFTCPEEHRSEEPRAPCQGPGKTCLRMPLPQKLQNMVGLLWANVSTASLLSFHKASTVQERRFVSLLNANKKEFFFIFKSLPLLS